MHLRRNNKKAIAESFKEFTDIDRYIQVIIDIYSSSNIKRKFWLTDREKQFFIATIINVVEGNINPISDDAIQIYKKYFNPETNKVKISDYINRIRKKEWLRYDKKNRIVEIPPIFHGIGIDNDMVTFNLRFSYESFDRSNTS